MSELIENDIRFARDDQERRILDLVRAAPEDQREHLERMLRAYLATLAADIDPPQA